MRDSALGVGIIGAGAIVGLHCMAYRSLSECARLVAVADVDEGRANAAKQAFSFRHSYKDYRDLLGREDIDVVSVCTPPHVHTPIVLDALAAGKNVLCEKPMARTLEEADHVVKATERNLGGKCSYVFQYRTDPAHLRIRKLIRDNALGKILMATVRVRAKRTPAYYARVPGRGSWGIDGGGVLINQSIHQLDALTSFLGNPVEVSAVMDTFVQPTEGEDTLAAWIRFANGAVATIDCTVCAHEDWFTIEVLGQNAQVSVHGTPAHHYCTWSVESKSSAVKKALRASGLSEFPDLPTGPSLSRVRAQKLLCKVRGREWVPPRHWGHTPHVSAFLKAVGTTSEVPVPPREARRSLELAVALYASAITQTTVQLPIDPSSPFYRGVHCGRGLSGRRSN